MTIRVTGKEKKEFDGSVGNFIPYLLLFLVQKFEARSNQGSNPFSCPVS